MLVHGVEAVQHRQELIGPDRDHGGEADRAVHRVAAADPVPAPEHAGRVDAEGGNGRMVGGDRGKMPGNGGIGAECADKPGPGGAGIGHRFERRERLGGDDEQRLCRIQAVRRLGEGRAVEIGHEAEHHRAVAERLHCTVGHLRPEIRSAYADADDVADALAGVAQGGPLAKPGREDGHCVEHPVHVRHHDLPIKLDALAAWRPQCHVQHGPALRRVDLLPGEHGIAPPGHALLVGQRQQQAERLLGDTVFRVIEE